MITARQMYDSLPSFTDTWNDIKYFIIFVTTIGTIIIAIAGAFWFYSTNELMKQPEFQEAYKKYTERCPVRDTHDHNIPPAPPRKIPGC